MDENFDNLAGKVSQSAVVKEFAGEFESFVLSTIEKYHNVRSSTYDPSEHKWRKPYIKESNICFYWKRVKYEISLKIKVEAQRKLRKEPKNLLI